MKRVRAYQLIPPKMLTKMLPEPLATKFRVNWLPIFNFLDPVKAIPRHAVLTDDGINDLYVECMEFLKSRVSYVWNRGQRSNPKEFSVATWSKSISRGEIAKLGTESDKLLLKEPTNRNKAGAVAGGKRKRQPKSNNVKHPTRQERRTAERGGGTVTTVGGVNVGGNGGEAVVGEEDVAVASGNTVTGGRAVAHLPRGSNGGRSSNNTGGRAGRGGAGGPPRGRGRGFRGHGNHDDDDGGGKLFAAAFAEVPVDTELPEALQRRHQEIVREDRANEERVQFEAETRQIVEEGWASRPIPALRNYGDVSGFDRQQMVHVIERAVAQAPMMTQGQAVAVATAAKGRSIGCCCITGCILSSMELIHRCHTCKEFIHILCAEPFNDLSEDERYCDICVPKK
jgi:hypothetical protein